MSSVGNLTCLTGPNRGREYQLTAQLSTVGRAEGCTIRLEENLISRQHAEIHRVGNRYQLHDLGSKNGIYVNNQLMAPRSTMWLKSGYEISFAFVRFSFSDLAATSTSAVLPARLEPALRVDPLAREVYVDGERLSPPFSVKQFELLYFLIQNQDRVVSRDDIAQAVWPESQGITYDANIDRLVSRVRSRIEPCGGNSPRFISTVHGCGFRLTVDNRTFNYTDHNVNNAIASTAERRHQHGEHCHSHQSTLYSVSC